MITAKVTKHKLVSPNGKMIFHHVWVGSMECVDRAIQCAKYWGTPEDRGVFKKINYAQTIRTGILDGHWPEFDFRNACTESADVVIMVQEIGKNLLYAMHVEDEPGFDAEDRDNYLRQNGLMPPEWD